MSFKKTIKRVDIQASLICALLVIFSGVSIFLICYNVTHENTIQTLKDRTDAIYNATSSLLTEDIFNHINVAEDMDSEVYKTYQQKLLELRKVSDVRYLYTAKKNAEGKYIYAIDGLNQDSGDFRKPGELIEPEIIEDIERAYQGNTILPNDILSTSWGQIYLAYYPIYDQGNYQIIGILGIEIPAESQYNTYHSLLATMPLIILGSCVLAFIIFASCFKYISNPSRKDLYNVDGLTKLKNRASLDSDIRSIYSKVTKISATMIDLNQLKKMNDNHGHDEGDRYIQLAAEVVDHLKNRGICYRFGGDEFVIISDIVDEKILEQSTQEIQRVFAEKAKVLKGEAGLSIGYAIFDGEHDKDLMDTIKRADKMMYENKRKNRERR